MDKEFEKRKYIENLLLLNLQKKEIKELIENPNQNGLQPISVYLINKDSIDVYLDNELSKEIMNIINNDSINFNDFISSKDKYINLILNNNNININNIKKNELNLNLLLTETLKIYNEYYPDNFFIIEKNKFEEILDHKEELLKNFNLYKIIIRKDGIFILNSEIKENYHLYYLQNLEKRNIEQIFVIQDESVLNKELDLFIKNGRNNYFLLRNIKVRELGSFNLIDDGKIIGKYYNLKRIDNLNIEDSEDSEINITRLNKKYELEEEKENIIKLFIPNLLTCLSKIKELKNNLNEILDNSNKLQDNNITSEKYILTNAFANFIYYFNENNNNNIDKISEQIGNFMDTFFKRKNLKNKIKISRTNKFIFYKNIIKILIEELQNEFCECSWKEKSFEENQKKSNIFNLFYGKIGNQNENQYFNTISIKPDEYAGNDETIGLEYIMNTNRFKENTKITLLPKILILVISLEYKNYLSVPVELKISNENKNYDLLGCIQFTEASFISIVKNSNNNNFIKICYDENYNYTIEEIVNQEEVLNNCFIYIYSQKSNYNNVNGNHDTIGNQ